MCSSGGVETGHFLADAIPNDIFIVLFLCTNANHSFFLKYIHFINFQQVPERNLRTVCLGTIVLITVRLAIGKYFFAVRLATIFYQSHCPNLSPENGTCSVFMLF